MHTAIEHMEIVFAILTGIGLSAACGFRVFVPLLFLNLASIYGYVHLAPGFEWIGGNQATIALTLASALEITAYYFPLLDNILDAISSPVSMIAGILATASLITDMPSSLKWMISIVAGGGIAGILQGATVVLRVKSSLFTGTIGNAGIATLELAGAAILSLLAIIIPLIAFIVAALFAVYWIFQIFYDKLKAP